MPYTNIVYHIISLSAPIYITHIIEESSDSNTQSKRSSKSPVSPSLSYLKRGVDAEKSNKPGALLVLQTYKWSCILIRLIFQILLLLCLCMWWGVMRRAIKSKDVGSQARALLKSALFVLFSLACLGRAEASLWSLSTQHSTFIINLAESLPPSQFSQLQLGPCDLLPVSFVAALVGFDVSINTKELGTES